MNVPNSLTLIRIFLVPLLVVVLLTRAPDFELWGVLIFLLAALTDWLDGFLARKREQITPLGVMLDPIADKLLIAAALISLVELGLAPAWMVAIIVGRELAVLGLRTIALAQGFHVAVSDLGKAKMVLQVFATALLILSVRHPALSVAGKAALWLVVLFALLSAVRYFAEFGRRMNGRAREGRRPFVFVESEKKQDVAAP